MSFNDVALYSTLSGVLKNVRSSPTNSQKLKMNYHKNSIKQNYQTTCLNFKNNNPTLSLRLTEILASPFKTGIRSFKLILCFYSLTWARKWGFSEKSEIYSQKQNKQIKKQPLKPCSCCGLLDDNCKRSVKIILMSFTCFWILVKQYTWKFTSNNNEFVQALKIQFRLKSVYILVDLPL